ncbi:glycosyltransferase family 4 protein [Kribbella sp. GL6]|uniref:glycosyltransferase family 4 protein n=1 Tax=unclassified Kribbella TaxID=2644121 RepID=UPI003669EBC7
MHVVIVVENVPLGVDTRLRKQVEDLLDAGCRLTVISMRHPDNTPYRDRLRLLEYPPPVERPGPVGYAIEYAQAFGWAAWHVLRTRLRGRIDVLHLCQPPDIYFPLAWMLRLTGTRIVIDQRDLMPELLRGRYDGDPPGQLLRILRWLERRSQKVAQHAITVNGYLKDRMVKAGAEPDLVTVVRNGPVLARVRQAEPDPALRGEHRHLVCWIGKMGRQDRVDLVVRTAERMVRELGRTDCGFVVLGDGECLEELRELTRELDLERWVSFPGWLPEASVFGYLATADVGIDTSLQVEVSPVKAMEYMALGLPVVCFDLQESRAIIEGAGRFAAPGDVAQLTDAVVELLDDPAMSKQLGEAGRRRITEELAWERQVPAYLSAVTGTRLPADR